MSNSEPPKVNGVGGNIGGVLTTLASSGDNWVKMFIVVGIILNTVMTKNNGSGIQNNEREVSKLRYTVAQQIKSIYKNQQIYYRYMLEARADRDRILEKLGIPASRAHPLPTPNEYDPNQYQEQE